MNVLFNLEIIHVFASLLNEFCISLPLNIVKYNPQSLVDLFGMITDL